ncbi:hypothetical protein [Hypericibacter sp.]|uniref:hypothetical protein n=1 Tax=Hypericibacter sp. TaxID=2705401 RepID=UPI003D6D4A95
MKTSAKNVRHRFRQNRPQAPTANTPDNDLVEQYHRLRQEILLDEALKDTFPASDPVSSFDFTF